MFWRLYNKCHLFQPKYLCHFKFCKECFCTPLSLLNQLPLSTKSNNILVPHNTSQLGMTHSPLSCWKSLLQWPLSKMRPKRWWFEVWSKQVGCRWKCAHTSILSLLIKLVCIPSSLRSSIRSPLNPEACVQLLPATFVFPDTCGFVSGLWVFWFIYLAGIGQKWPCQMCAHKKFSFLMHLLIGYPILMLSSLVLPASVYGLLIPIPSCLFVGEKIVATNFAWTLTWKFEIIGDKDTPWDLAKM